ncbi:MAG: hypothetical protein HN348_16475, partial [Proteobacteria bacterium]|nr:hypothetical protein [Pseudomonadota bacterium]
MFGRRVVLILFALVFSALGCGGLMGTTDDQSMMPTMDPNAPMVAPMGTAAPTPGGAMPAAAPVPTGPTAAAAPTP